MKRLISAAMMIGIVWIPAITFGAECEKAKLGIDPVTGEELEKAVAGAFKTSPALVAKLKEILYK